MRPGEEQLKSWMVAGLNGDANAHACLLRALVPILGQFYRHRLGDDHAIEDLVQDSLIAVHTRRITYDQARAVTPWLFAVARYKMIDHLRRIRPTCSIDDLKHDVVTDGFEDAAIAQIDVDHLLAGLPDKQSRLIREIRIEGHSVAETAQTSGYSESDVKVSVHRGLKALAARIRRGSR